MIRQELQKQKLPDKPGVYFFLKGKDILYIGKATSLRDRTKSYFAKDLIATRGPLIVDMVFKADNIKWEETDSVLEALILEANLIKKHQPYYNTKEKDDKSWNYVCITNPIRGGNTLRALAASNGTGEPLPIVIIERGKNIDLEKLTVKGQKLKALFGPFTSGGQLKEALKIVRRIFPFIDAQSAKKDNHEFYRQLGLAPDTSDSAARIAYMKNIRNIRLFFEGKKKQIIRDLEKDMKALAKAHKFEEAARVRNQLFALKHINDVALLKNEFYSKLDTSGKPLVATFRIEAYDIAHMSGKNMVGVMTVIEDGMPAKGEYRKFNIKTQSGANDTGALLEVLERRFTHTEWPMPSLIVVDGGQAQINAAQRFQERVGLMIPLVSVVKDERHRPRAVMGDKAAARQHESAILLANSEAHRFAITFHKKKRAKDFLK